MSKKDHRAEVKQSYEKLAKKYGMPKFEDFNKEFDLSKIDTEANIMKEIMICTYARINDFMRFFDPVLDPNPGTLHSFIEIDFFGKEEKSKLFNLYKKLGHIAHMCFLADVDGEKASAEFIKKVWKLWPETKKEIRLFMEKITEAWDKAEKEGKTINEYFG